MLADDNGTAGLLGLVDRHSVNITTFKSKYYRNMNYKNYVKII